MYYPLTGQGSIPFDVLELTISCAVTQASNTLHRHTVLQIYHIPKTDLIVRWIHTVVIQELKTRQRDGGLKMRGHSRRSNVTVLSNSSVYVTTVRTPHHYILYQYRIKTQMPFQVNSTYIIR